ncbi:MAG TPA: hypothetical protein VI732_01445 [Alphaproteobacteria bacterium]|nr:hypothetical protein [Alphaproteobacteria bacterium]
MHEKATSAKNPARILGALLGALALLSCASPPPEQTFAEITWSHLPPFKFNVSRVDVVTAYKPTFQEPFVEHLFPVPPEKVVRRWIADRVMPGGPSGWAKVIINDASVKETELHHPHDLKSHFTVEQGERYEASIDVTIELYTPKGVREGFANARAVHTQTVPENATLNERERFWYDLTDSVMQDFNAEMERNIHAYLERFLVPG